MTAAAYSFRLNEGRSMALSSEVSGLVQGLRSVSDAAEVTCPALVEGETCNGQHHSVDRTARRCPLARYRTERRRLSAQLALCGFGADIDPFAVSVANALRVGMDSQRDVAGLRELLAAVDALRTAPFSAPGHVAFVGPVGVAKTHALLLLYFAALQAGTRAHWLTGAEICALALLLASYDPETAAAAQGQLLSWRGYKLLVIDDLGDRLSDPRARGAGSSRAAALLQDLLNATQARVFWASNLTVKELREHADIGPRLVDRLCADHHGVPCVKVLLSGKSQRHHAARSAD